jgi:hypothetical protein
VNFGKEVFGEKCRNWLRKSWISADGDFGYTFQEVIKETAKYRQLDTANTSSKGFKGMAQIVVLQNIHS